MKTTKKSEIFLGYEFTKSYSFKFWRLICKLKRLMDPNWDNETNSRSQKYSYYSSTWIKKIITPSKAFKQWLKLKTVEKSIKNRLFLVGKKYLPFQVKLFFKKYSFGYFSPPPNPVSRKIQKQWDSWVETRGNKSLDIIDFGVIAYDYRIQRPQHLAQELTKLGHRVFYVENAFVSVQRGKLPQPTVSEKSFNLYTVQLASSKNYFIYQDVPSESDKKILVNSLKVLFREARIVNPVAKIDHPFWAAIANELGMPIVYDVMDLHAGFKETSSHNLQNEKYLLEKSEIILSSSDYLSHEFQEYKDKILSLKNAGEYTHFTPAARPTVPFPQDLKKIKGPIIGYYGALADWFNTSLIENLAKDFPQTAIVLIGLVNNADLESLATKYPNIHLLGEKPYAELPAYLAKFDVCLIPFKLSKLIQATNPVKIYEYFASGKPVVATSIPELMPYKKLLYLADDPISFSRAVKRALAEKSIILPEQRRIVAKMNTWHDRATTFEKHLLQKLYPQVSIIILTYNHADLSKISIDSTLYQSKYPNFEILIVDNNSDAATIRMLKKYQRTKNVRLIFNSSNYGFAKGNNIGMQLARGEYIVLLNNDVKVIPGWIERLIYRFKSGRVGLVGPVTNSIGNEARINVMYDPENKAEMEEEINNYIYSHWGETLKLRNIAAFAWAMPKAVYQLVGGLDERFGRGLFEDDDYCVRVRKENLSILCAEDAFVHHYGGASTNWGSPEFQKLFNENKAKFEAKWNRKWQKHKYRNWL